MSGEVKSLLKEARDAIKNKEFTTSMKLSKTILKHDKSNYMALVFLGISLQEIGPVEQTPNAFRKAIQIDPKNILAWNGLLKYYERQEGEKPKDQLLDVYISLLELDTNEVKLVDYSQHIAELFNSDCSDKVERIVKAAERIIKEEFSDNIKDEGHKLIALILSQVPVLEDVYEKSLDHIVTKEDLATKQHFHNYLKVLYINKQWEKLLTVAEAMHKKFDTELSPLEWICKVFNELYVEDNPLAETYRSKAEKYGEALVNIKSDLSTALFTKSIILYINGDYLESKTLLKRVLLYQPNLPHPWYSLSKCFVTLYNYEDALESAETLKKILLNNEQLNETLFNKFNLLLLKILANIFTESKRGIELGEKLLKENPNDWEIKYNLTKCYLNEGRMDDAEKLLQQIDNLKSIPITSRLLCLKGQKEEALQVLEKNVEHFQDCECWIELGKLQWEKEKYENSLISFLKGAKLNPNCYLSFLHLGNYYNKFGDLIKASRCYEKAVKLNEKCIEAATKLSKIYRDQKNWEYNIELLKILAGDVLNLENCWIWLQLGLSYMELEDYTQAIETLRYVVRTYPENGHAWESLADAYMARGAYTSALKSYQQALEQTASKLYPLLQIATIKQILGQYSESRSDYETILSSNPKYVPALKGLAETCLRQARLYKRNQLLGLSRDCVQSALNALTTAIQEQSNLSCLWKLTADCCCLVATLPDKYCFLMVLKALVEGKPIDGKSFLEQEDLFSLAERCYCKALSIFEDNILILHDLGACYLTHALSTVSRDKSSKLLEKAMATVQFCVEKDPTYWCHWNLLGNVAFHKEPKNYALSQHAFIKALTLNHNCSVAWNNLATLYLTLGDWNLANETFCQAQRTDPNFVNGWLGQAIIADMLKHPDAMDLFRHTTQLEFHPQGAVGYGNWVCKTLLEAPPHSVIYSIDNMHAIPVAHDALTWYTEIYGNDACAWNMLGLLKERMGLKLGALQAFKIALGNCREDQKDKARVNYARLLAKMEKYQEAIDMYKSVKKANFNSGSGLALALFKNQCFEESYETYKQALHWLTEEENSQSDLLVALASMAYMFQGPDAAKTLLFQSIQLKPPSYYGLYATLSLGLLHNDLNLSQLVLKELHNLRDDPHCLPDYATLLSYTYLLQGEYEKAVRELSKLIHRHANYPFLWYSLAILLVRLLKQRPKSLRAASKCAEIAMKQGKTTMDITKVLYMVSLASFLVGDNEHALISAQKAVHCYPNVAESWTVLMCALKSSSVEWNSKQVWMERAMSYLKSDLNVSSPVVKWIEGQLIKRNEKVVFMGDDTWGGLYPKRFIRNYPYPSFNVFDLDTVDKGVISHLYSELDKTDWKLLIGHFLGVDHCGHRYGPSHFEMSRKLGEMNEVIINVTKNISDDTILFVIGDHGMTKTGDHGGESTDEVTAAMFVHSKSPLIFTDPTLYNDTVKQIDLVPTIATILGIPVPHSNLGVTILNSLPVYNKNDYTSWKTLLFSVWGNVLQATNYIKEYASNSGTFNEEKLAVLYEKFNSLEQDLLTIADEKDFFKFVKQAQNYLILLRNLCEEVWIQFDSISMSRGLILNFLTIFCIYTIIDGIPSYHFPLIFNSSFLPCSYIALFLSALISVACYCLKLVDHLVPTLFFYTCTTSVFLLAVFIIQNWESIALHWFNLRKYQSVSRVICRVIFALTSFAVFSNSYILEEGALSSYLFLTIVLLITYESIACNKIKDLKPLKNATSNLKAKIVKLNLKPLLMALGIFLLVRLSKLFWRCREEQVWCSVLSDSEATLKSFTGSSGKLEYIITLVLLGVCVTFTRNWLSDNLVGYNPVTFLARYSPTVMVVCTGGFWVLHRLPNDAKNKVANGWQVNLFAWIVLGLVAVQIVCIVIKPLSVYIIHQKEKLSVNMNSNIIPQLFNVVKGLCNRKKEEQDVFYVCGLATIYSSIYIILGLKIILLLALLLGDRLASSSVLLYFSTVCLLGIIGVSRYEKSTKIEDLFEVENSALLSWVLISQYFFYGTGHQPNFPSIPWEAAFVGTWEGNNFLQAALVVMNIFGSHIFIGLMLPLIFLVPFSLPVVLPHLFGKKPHNETASGEMILYENSELMLTSVFSLCAKYLLYHAARIFFCLMATTIHCRHLMVWGVFAPKLIFEVIGMLVTIVSVLLGYLLLVHINYNVDKLYVKFYKQRR